MSKVVGVEISPDMRPWLSTQEVMGFLMIKDYETFAKNYINKGLKWWRQVGKTKYWLKVEVIKFVNDKGDLPDLHQTAPKGRPKKEKPTRLMDVTRGYEIENY